MLPCFLNLRIIIGGFLFLFCKHGVQARLLALQLRPVRLQLLPVRFQLLLICLQQRLVFLQLDFFVFQLQPQVMDQVLRLDIFKKHGILVFMHLLHHIQLVQNVGKPLSLQNGIQIGVLAALINHPGAYGHALPLGSLPLHCSFILLLSLYNLKLLLGNLLFLAGDFRFLLRDFSFFRGNLIFLQANGGHHVHDLGVQVVNLLLEDVLLTFQCHNLLVDILQLVRVLVNLPLNIGNAAGPGNHAQIPVKTHTARRQAAYQYEIQYFFIFSSHGFKHTTLHAIFHP